MNKFKLLSIALVLAACGTQEGGDAKENAEMTQAPTPVQKNPAMALRDSAMQIVYGAPGEVDAEKSLRLLDEAMAMDPGNRSIFYSKMQVLSKFGTEEDVFNMLVRLDTLDFKDGYTTLQLGVEYEMRGETEKADAKYYDAIAIFSAILDTMQNTQFISRNNNILNLAVAERLANQNQQKLQSVMNDEEKEYLKDILDQIKNAKREDLLKMNRKKTK